MTVKDAPVSTAGGKAYDLIRSAILSGEFSPGRRLKEEELTTLCEVSRTPVREALRRLALEGLVVVTPNAGAQVSETSPGELAEVYALRAMIEGHAAERAASRIDAGALARLRELAGEMEGSLGLAAEAFSREFAAVNAEFHRIILDAAMSPRLSAMAALVVELPLTRRTLALYSHDDLIRSMGHHRELVDAFEARDCAWAASVMKSHIHAAHQALVRYAHGPSGASAGL